jgi:two-component sensor histidine kinase
VWSLVYGGVLLAALVAATIYWVTNQIAGSVQRLAADAKRLGSGEPLQARDYPITEIATVSSAIGEASRQRLAAEAEVRFLLRELAHRSKNQMTVIAAMAKQTAKGAESVPEFVQDFEKRIFGLARSTDLLLANGVLGVDLRELLSRQIEPFCPLDSGRVSLSGSPVRLNNQAAQILGMAAHELATNAVKYGAFAREDGTLTVTWDRHGDRLAFSWCEHVRSLPTRAERRGFGTVVLENMVGTALGAEVERVAHADGIEWRFEIPYDVLDPSAGPVPEPGPNSSAPPEAEPAPSAG